jgi:hypothetical protein
MNHHHHSRWTWRRLIACVCALAGTVATAPLHAAMDDYTLKDERARVGTSIVRTRATGPLPFDKTWSELDSAQRAAARASYRGMPASDEPPFPAAGLAPMARILVEGLWRMLADGDLRLRVQVDADGRASNVDIIDCPAGKAGAEFAAGVVTLTPFKPAVCDGRPCAGSFLLELVVAVWRD